MRRLFFVHDKIEELRYSAVLLKKAGTSAVAAYFFVMEIIEIKKFIALILAASSTSFFYLQGSAWSKSSLLLQMPAFLAASKKESIIPTVTSATGRIWMDRNLGASRVATSIDDEQAYGDLYQWGRLADGHEKRDSSTTSTSSASDKPGHSKFITTTSDPHDWRNPQNNNLWQGKDGINNPCPAGFRLPTADEWQEEIDSWSSQDDAGAFASALKLPVAGFRDFNVGSLNGEGSISLYWSSTIDGTTAKMLQIDSSSAFVGGFFRAFGQSIRCIKEELVQIPTVVSATGQIWMDRNLGASRVATSMDDEQAYGDLYQWGRLADGHEKRDSSTTSTSSASDKPGHSKFITTDDYPYKWRSPGNNDLWQGASGINNPCPAGFRLPTESELRDEWASWSSTDAAGAFASPLKWVTAGLRSYYDGAIIDNDGFITNEGSAGYYWASTINNDLPRCLSFGNGFSGLGGEFAHAKGFSIRCIKD